MIIYQKYAVESWMRLKNGRAFITLFFFIWVVFLLSFFCIFQLLDITIISLLCLWFSVAVHWHAEVHNETAAFEWWQHHLKLWVSVRFGSSPLQAPFPVAAPFGINKQNVQSSLISNTWQPGLTFRLIFLKDTMHWG